jgi:hypothetical protein
VPPPRDIGTQLFTQLEQAERDAQRDMQVRGARLTTFIVGREGKQWREQENGEWWLVPVIEA